VYALENGTQGWSLADHVLEHGTSRCYAPQSGSTALAANARRLAQRFQVREVDAATVRQWAEEPDRTLYLCDVRTPEEFAAGTLAGAQHTPGGQLIQAFDQYVGVRGARLVLFDSDGVRAPTVATWLRQMGHDASVLVGGVASGLALPTRHRAEAPPLQGIGASAAASELAAGRAVVIDLRSSVDFRKAHIPGARWSIRPRLSECMRGEPRTAVLVCDDAEVAAWAVDSEWPPQLARPLRLEGGLAAWRALGLPLSATPDVPADSECVDFLFFVHDRHDGNKEAARRYLAWETGLAAQVDAQELAAFRLPAIHG